MDRRTIRGSEIAIWRSGEGARDLVFVHGFSNDHSGWQPLIERLDHGRYRFTVFDLVGCGASGGATSWKRCTIDEYQADLVGVCDELDLVAPIVIGHSLGAATGLSAGLSHPGRFGALVLIAPASTTGLDFLPDEESFESLAHPTPAQQRALARAAFRHPPADGDFEQLMAAVALATPEHIEGAARSMRAFTPIAELGDLDLPTLIVCGDRDRHVPLRNHLAAHRAIPRCGLQVYHDVGHVPFAETPDACAADVARFLGVVT